MCSRVLVVEDEALVGWFFRETLLDGGFDVHLLAEGKSALPVLQDKCLCAAIIDVGLPDLRGDELAARLRSGRPHLPILLVTGYDEHELERRFARDPHLRVLSKPVDAPALMEALEALLSDPACSSFRSTLCPEAGVA